MSCSRAFISLGGNQGNVVTTISNCLAELNQLQNVRVVNQSRNYLTAPVGSAAENQFVNAAAELETTLTPHELLHQLQLLETKLGRVRTIHWGPRTLDLDLIFFEEQKINTPKLTVPHPAAWYRRFVLKPLAEIAPEVLHPVKHTSVAELLRMLESEPYFVLAAGTAERIRLLQSVVEQFPSIRLTVVTKLEETSSPHSLFLHLTKSETISFAGSPSKTRLDLSDLPTDKLQQTFNDIFTSALGNVALASES